MKILSSRANALVKSGYIAEQTRCAKDPVYFMTKYCKLEERCAMVEVVKGLQDHRRIIAKHPRQIGITTTAIAYALWKATFQPNQSIVFATVNSMMASAAAIQFGAMHKALPEWLSTNNESLTQTARFFKNGSAVRFYAVSPTILKSLKLDLLILDSFASNPAELKDDVWWNLLTSITVRQLLIASTPCNSQDMFSGIWNQAEARQIPLFPINLAFHQLPAEVQDTYRENRLMYGRDVFWQECLGNFTHGELYDNMVKCNNFQFK